MQVNENHQGRQTGLCLAALLWAGSFNASEPVPSHAGLGFQGSGKRQLDLRNERVKVQNNEKVLSARLLGIQSWG